MIIPSIESNANGANEQDPAGNPYLPKALSLKHCKNTLAALYTILTEHQFSQSTSTLIFTMA